MKRKLPILVLFALSLFAACKKKDNDTPKADTHFYIKNNIGQTAHIAIYTSQNDYNRSTNALVSADLAAGAVYDWKNADTTLNYYYDWYTPDYVYSNWGVQRAYLYDTILKSNIPLCMLNITKAGLKSQTMRGDTLSIEQAYTTDTAGIFTNYGRRSAYINGNDSESVWECFSVSGYSPYYPNWNAALDIYNKAKLIFKKDMYYTEWRYASQGSGFTASFQGYYLLTQYGKPIIELYPDNGKSRSYYSKNYFITLTAADTATFFEDGIYYYLKRQ